MEWVGRFWLLQPRACALSFRVVLSDVLGKRSWRDRFRKPKMEVQIFERRKAGAKAKRRIREQQRTGRSRRSGRNQSALPLPVERPPAGAFAGVYSGLTGCSGGQLSARGGSRRPVVRRELRRPEPLTAWRSNARVAQATTCQSSSSSRSTRRFPLRCRRASLMLRPQVQPRFAETASQWCTRAGQRYTCVATRGPTACRRSSLHLLNSRRP